VITCHCSFTISSDGPQPPSPSALPSVAQSYTGSMGQAVALARRWTKPMADLFPTTTMMYSIPYRVVRPFPTSLPCRPAVLRLDHTYLPDPTPPTTTFTTAPSPYYVNVFKTTSCPFPLKRLSQLLCKPFGTVRCGDWYWPWDFRRRPVCRIGMSHNKPLSRDRIQDVALLSYLLTKWNNERQKKQAESATLHLEQPVGADGFGQVGLGRGANKGRNTSNGIMEGRKIKQDRTRYIKRMDDYTI
jgi:hypothetical protein